MKSKIKTNTVSAIGSPAERIMEGLRVQESVRLAPSIKALAAKIAQGTGMNELKANAFASVLMARSELAARAGTSFGGRRDLYTLCGYPSVLKTAELGVRYERQDIAKRIVDAYPKAAFRTPPEIYEDEEKDDTEFESAIKGLAKRAHLWSHFQRVDRLAGQGQFSLLLMGLGDGQPLNQPVRLAPELGAARPSKKMKLLYLQPYGELDSQISTWVEDPKSERFGLPLMYNIQIRRTDNGTGSAQMVHWTRVLHVAQDCLTSDVYGTPILKAVYNRLQDLETILAGSSEMFWRGGWPGLSLEADPTMDMTQNAAAMQTEADNYMLGLSRLLRLQGVQAKQLSPNISDPTAHVTAVLQVISGATGIPMRILTGSERGELASSQDKENWNARVHEYQMIHCEPNILRPFVERMILAGVIPAPQAVDEDGDPTFMVKWEDQATLTDAEKMDVAVKKTTAMSAYVGGQVDALMPPQKYLTLVLGYEEDEAADILEEAEQHLTEVEQDNADKIAEQQAEAGVVPEGEEGATPPGGAQKPAPKPGAGSPSDKAGKPNPKVTIKVHGNR